MDMGLRTQIISVQIICIACGKIGVGYVFPIESKEIFFICDINGYCITTIDYFIVFVT